MKTVRLLLDAKGREAYSIQPDRTVYEALQVLSEKDIGALLVMEGINLLGIVSERDYARKVFLLGKTSMETLVHEIMTVQPVCVRPDQSVGECMALMTERRVRHLPVLEAGRVVGVISIGDVVKCIIAEQEFVIEQLEGYITRRR